MQSRLARLPLDTPKTARVRIHTTEPFEKHVQIRLDIFRQHRHRVIEFRVRQRQSHEVRQRRRNADCVQLIQHPATRGEREALALATQLVWVRRKHFTIPLTRLALTERELKQAPTIGVT
jgi:hypothetical protein